MSNKLLEAVAFIIGGFALYLVAENNLPAVKRSISNIQPSIFPTTTIIPISTTSPWTHVPPSQKRRACPPGMYEDYTDGILHCHDAHGTRELGPPGPSRPGEANFQNPLVPAFGKVVDNDEFG